MARWDDMRRRLGTGLAVVAVAVGAVLCADTQTAGAAPNPPWPQLLPGLPGDTRVQPHPVPNCRHAGLACIDGLVTRLGAVWRRQDRACDHRALFTLAYIRITQGLRDGLAGGRVFRYPRWFTYVIIDFSNHYLRWLRDYDRGRPVPAAWKITFDAAAHGNDNGGQDVLLASNAHTQQDLPHIYADMGVRTPRGASRKHDHDVVNAVNAQVFDGLETYYRRHYDPFFAYPQAIPPLNQGTLETVKGWRELAWRNAEQLLSAHRADQRAALDSSIAANSTLWAQLIHSGQQPGYRALRDAYCRAHHENR